MAKNWRRGKSKNLGVTTNNTKSAALWRDYAALGTWDAVASKYGVTRAMAFRVAHGYQPRSAKVRLALGLPALAPAPVCPAHGIVHTGRCPRPRPAPKSLWDWPVRELARALRERVTLSP